MRILLVAVLYLIFTSLPLGVTWAQCPAGSVTFVRQQQIDDFGAKYPRCTEIPGRLQIGATHQPSDIHDLTPLRNIRYIGGDLNIINNPLLQNLDGLQNLSSVDGYLNIFKNDNIKNLDALSGLSQVNGNLWIIRNQNLTSISGLINLASIKGSLDVSFNPRLSSFEGLQNIDPQSIATSPTYQLTPVINVHLIENGTNSEDSLANIVAFRENHNPLPIFKTFIQVPYSDREIQTDLIFKYIDQLRDSIQAYQLLDEIFHYAQESGNKELFWESELIRHYYELMHGTGPFLHRIAGMKNLADRAGRAEKWPIKARALKFIALRYRKDLFDYEKLFKTHDALERTIDLMGDTEFPDRAQCYMNMGLAHYLFRDYREAIHFFQKGAAIPKTPFNTTYVTHCINNLGLCYQKLNQPDSSDYYFSQILRDTTHYAVEIWKGIASGNLGNNYYLRKDYDRAIPLLHRDWGTAETFEDLGLAAGALTPLADILISYNQLDEAENLIFRAREYVSLSGQTDRLRMLYPVMGKWHAAMGHKEDAAKYIDSTQYAMRAYNDKFNALKLLRARQELNAQKLQNQEDRRQKLILQRNFIVTILVMLAISGYILFRHRHKTLLHKQKIQDLALQNAQSSLNNLRMKIRKNNILIDKLQQQTSVYGDQQILQELKNATILTKEDWKQFKKLFRQAYPGFLTCLHQRYPVLTPAEIRILCLQKLGLTNEEMAAAQGVSANGIMVTQHRIRKKLNIKNQKMLEEWTYKLEIG